MRNLLPGLALAIFFVMLPTGPCAWAQYAAPPAVVLEVTVPEGTLCACTDILLSVRVKDEDSADDPPPYYDSISVWSPTGFDWSHVNLPAEKESENGEWTGWWKCTITVRYYSGGSKTGWVRVKDNGDYANDPSVCPQGTPSYDACKEVQLTLKDKWSPDEEIKSSIAAPSNPWRVDAGASLTCTAGPTSDRDRKNCSTGQEVADEVSYKWTTTGGTFQNGVDDQSQVTWIAPQDVGKYVITLTVDDKNDENKPEGDCGSRNDAPKVSTVDVWVCPHAHPCNWTQDDAGAYPSQPPVGQVRDGEIWFKYIWASTSGNKEHLQDVTLQEYVAYDPPVGTCSQYNTYLPPDPPFDSWRHKNPTCKPEPPGSANAAYMIDRNLRLDTWAKPYTAVSYHANQVYRFHCPVCMASDVWQSLATYTIERRVEQASGGGTWLYQVTKIDTNVADSFTLPP